MEELPLPVVCLVLERIEGLAPERLIQLSSCFSNRKWLRACREDVPWRAALRNTGGVLEIPKFGLYRWFVEEYVPAVAKVVEEMRVGYTRIWSGAGMYGEAKGSFETSDDAFKEGPCDCHFSGIGSNLQLGFLDMRSMRECLHPHCRARSVQVFSCTVQQTGNYFSPQQTHTHWLQCCVCRRRFWFEEVGYG